MSQGGLGLVVVAAGSSRRMAGVDKLWQDLGGEPLIVYALSRLAPLADCAVLVVRADDIRRARDATGAMPSVEVVAGGRERYESVARGLHALPTGVDRVAVHDAARPFATPALLIQGIKALADCDGAIPAIPVADTVKRVDAAGHVKETVDRGDLRAVQTPQVFRGAALRASHESSSSGVTDDASLLERRGYCVRIFPGSPANFKITTVHDLAVARLMLAGDLVS